MQPEVHLQAFEERKETIFKWAVEVRGLSQSQRIIGDQASKAITELLSAYLHKFNKVEQGFQLNHAWFKSPKVMERLPLFPHKDVIITKMIELELLCEKLAYGAPKSVELSKKAIGLFQELEKTIKEELK